MHPLSETPWRKAEAMAFESDHWITEIENRKAPSEDLMVMNVDRASRNEGA